MSIGFEFWKTIDVTVQFFRDRYSKSSTVHGGWQPEISTKKHGSTVMCISRPRFAENDYFFTDTLKIITSTSKIVAIDIAAGNGSTHSGQLLL